MFFSHMPELLLVLVGALIIFGPKRLPEIGSSLGKGIRDFKHSVSDVQDHVRVDVLPHSEDHTAGQ